MNTATITRYRVKTVDYVGSVTVYGLFDTVTGKLKQSESGNAVLFTCKHCAVEATTSLNC